MIHLLSNATQATHADKIKQLIVGADAIYIMVAFLKKSGLQKLLPYLEKARIAKIITGVNFGLTEPAALSALLDCSNKNAGITAFLNRLDSKQVFHPKIYLFEKSNKGHMIIGSANLTKGGLLDNNECSLYHECELTDQVWKDAVTFLEHCIRSENADLLTDRVIAIYRPYFKKQKWVNDQSMQFPDVDHSAFYNLETLKSHYDRLDKRKIKKDLREKEGYYDEAKKILNTIAARQRPPRVFADLLEDLVGKEKEPGLWYSNGMFRSKGEIFRQQEKFRRLVNSIKNNIGKRPRQIYDKARAISRDIYGLGPAYIGEIMMTYDRDNLANINSNPITVLRKEGGVDLKSTPQSFNGTDYEEYNSIVKEISFKLGLRNMLEADYFFNEVYQALKRQRLKNEGITPRLLF